MLENKQFNDRRKMEKDFRDIVNSQCNVLENEHFDYIHLVNSPDLTDVRPFTWNGWHSDVQYAYYLDLDNFEGKISKDARWAINKATNEGIAVERCEDATIIWRLWTETFARQHLRPPASEDFFKTMLVLMQNQNVGEMWIARTKSDEVAAAEIFVYDHKRVYRWCAASSTRLRKTDAPSLLLYEALRNLENKGFKEINLMAATMPRLAMFVAQFNPRLVPYYSVIRKNALAGIAEYWAPKLHLML